MKYIIGTILGMAAIMVCGYYERGYWAVGAEFMLPAIVFAFHTSTKESH